MQLMLLEERNRRRLHEARQEQDGSGGAPHTAPTGPSHALLHYQMQLMDLDQQNKRRLAKIREEKGQDAPHTAPVPPPDYEMQLRMQELRMQDERRLRKAEQDAETSTAGRPATGQAFYGDRPDVE
ncbi:hypothetical protein VE02_03574 [Pseudogymnoascus sp. 03VT05]|nr:hypothetical protein VE02_03574 [Pseudogymnoascus sp. 03VT05]